MKTRLIAAFALVTLLTASAYAQDTMPNQTKKEIRRQERAERKARVKGDLKEAGQHIGDAATEVGKSAKEDAKEAGQAIGTTAKKVGNAVSTGVDKAGNAIEKEADRLKAKRDSAQAAKARRDTL